MSKASTLIFEEKAPEGPVLSSGKKAKGGDSERRATILDCAEQVFLEQGFQAASMSAIAARLGGSKGTLYNYFPSKDELFLACVSRHCASLHEQMSAIGAEGGDVRETLTKMGRRYVAVVTSDDVVRKFRMVVAEAERAPEIARAFYEMGPQVGAEVIAAYFQRVMDEGKLVSSDAVRAARFFGGLCTNWYAKARLCNVAAAPDEETIARDVDEAVRIFLLAYGVEKAE